MTNDLVGPEGMPSAKTLSRVTMGSVNLIISLSWFCHPSLSHFKERGLGGESLWLTALNHCFANEKLSTFPVSESISSIRKCWYWRWVTVRTN